MSRRYTRTAAGIHGDAECSKPLARCDNAPNRFARCSFCWRRLQRHTPFGGGQLRQCRRYLRTQQKWFSGHWSAYLGPPGLVVRKVLDNRFDFLQASTRWRHSKGRGGVHHFRRKVLGRAIRVIGPGVVGNDVCVSGPWFPRLFVYAVFIHESPRSVHILANFSPHRFRLKIETSWNGNCGRSQLFLSSPRFPVNRKEF